MSVIEKLDSVLSAIDALKIEAREGGDARAYLRMANSVERACYEHLRNHGPAIRQAMIDAERYRWLRDTQQAATTSDWLGVYPADSRQCYYGPRLDAAIDAARATEAGGGEG